MSSSRRLRCGESLSSVPRKLNDDFSMAGVGAHGKIKLPIKGY